MAEPPPSYTPQAIHDILPLYNPGDSEDHIQTYYLRQLTTNTQTLSREGDASKYPLYQIQSFATGGFMNKKPHMIISRRVHQKVAQQGPPQALQHNDSDLPRPNRLLSIIPRRNSDLQAKPSSNTVQEPQYNPIAEARFEIHSTGTSIIYNFSPSLLSQEEQRLELENSQFQTLRTTIGGNTHHWQPFPGNKALLELLNELEEKVARFIYNTTATNIINSNTGRRKSAAATASSEIGELNIVEALAGGEREREEIICSAVVVVERARRRALNIGSQGVVSLGAYGGGGQMLTGG